MGAEGPNVGKSLSLAWTLTVTVKLLLETWNRSAISPLAGLLAGFPPVATTDAVPPVIASTNWVFTGRVAPAMLFVTDVVPV